MKNESRNSKYATSINLFTVLIAVLNTSILLHIKFTAVAQVADGQFLRARENTGKFLITRVGTLKLLSEGRKIMLIVPKCE